MLCFDSFSIRFDWIRFWLRVFLHFPVAVMCSGLEISMAMAYTYGYMPHRANRSCRWRRWRSAHVTADTANSRTIWKSSNAHTSRPQIAPIYTHDAAPIQYYTQYYTVCECCPCLSESIQAMDDPLVMWYGVETAIKRALYEIKVNFAFKRLRFYYKRVESLSIPSFFILFWKYLNKNFYFFKTFWNRFLYVHCYCNVCASLCFYNLTIRIIGGRISIPSLWQFKKYFQN